MLQQQNGVIQTEIMDKAQFKPFSKHPKSRLNTALFTYITIT